MKKLTVLLMMIMMVFSLAGSAAAGPAPAAEDADAEAAIAQDYMDYLWELSDDLDEEEFSLRVVRNQKIIAYLQYFFTEESYKEYYAAATHLKQKRDGARQEVIDATNQLEQTASLGETMLFLWADGNMPHDPEENLTVEAMDAMTIEGYGFEPYVIKFLAEDPYQAKGNLIIISGGSGNNETEGYPAVLRFTELGYNCFLLHRRTGTYPSLDNYMDTQRAVRVVRNYAAQEGLGGQNMVGIMGFSAGGKSILGMLDNAYGYLTPAAEGAADYVPDAIDAICSDVDVAMLIYSATGKAVNEANTNVPAIYLCVGDQDATANYENTLLMYDAIKDNTICEMYVVEGAGHGFGVGQEGATKSVPDCALWPEQADAFMQANLGHCGVQQVSVEETAVPEEEIPQIHVTAELKSAMEEYLPDCGIEYFDYNMDQRSDNNVIHITLYSYGLDDVSEAPRLISEAEEFLSGKLQELTGNEQARIRITILTEDGYVL